MNQILDAASLVFTPGAAGVGTIRFLGDAVPFEAIKLVANITRGVVVYQFNSTTRGSAGWSYLTNTLTLDLDTSTQSASDVLQAFVEVPDDHPSSLLSNLGYDPNGNPRTLRLNEDGHAIVADGRMFTGNRASVGNVLVLDTIGYQSVVVQLVGTWSATVAFEASNDGQTWFGMNGWFISTAGNTPTSSATGNASYAFPALARLFRVRLSAYTSGVVVVSAALRNSGSFVPWSTPQVSIGAIAGAALVAEDSALGTTAFPIGGLVRTALPASTVIAGDAIRATFSRSAQYVTKENAPGDLDFYINTTTTGTAQVLLRAAQATDVRTNITSIIYQNTSATAATLTIQDGLVTTLIQISVPASMTEPRQLVFPTPLRGSAATNLNYTQSAAASILLNVTGFNSY